MALTKTSNLVNILTARYLVYDGILNHRNKYLGIRHWLVLPFPLQQPFPAPKLTQLAANTTMEWLLFNRERGLLGAGGVVAGGVVSGIVVGGVVGGVTGGSESRGLAKVVGGSI